MTMRVVVLGPPASGKGTQSIRLADALHLTHIATGAVLRDAVESGTDLGRAARPYMDAGELVPDELIVDLVEDRLSDTERYVIDGFPRTSGQVRAFDAPIDVAAVLEVPRDELVRRVTGRRVCPDGHTYHVESDPPREPGICDVDGLPLERRDDDDEATLDRRLDVYDQQTRPAISLLTSRVELVRVDGCGSPDEVAAWMLEAVGQPAGNA